MINQVTPCSGGREVLLPPDDQFAEAFQTKR